MRNFDKCLFLLQIYIDYIKLALKYICLFDLVKLAHTIDGRLEYGQKKANLRELHQ